MQFWFYPVVLATIKLKRMQRALCLLRLCQIFMHISDMSQITHCSIVNCLDLHEWEQKVIQVNIRVLYVAICYATPYTILGKLIE